MCYTTPIIIGCDRSPIIIGCDRSLIAIGCAKNLQRLRCVPSFTRVSHRKRVSQIRECDLKRVRDLERVRGDLNHLNPHELSPRTTTHRKRVSQII